MGEGQFAVIFPIGILDDPQNIGLAVFYDRLKAKTLHRDITGCLAKDFTPCGLELEKLHKGVFGRKITLSLSHTAAGIDEKNTQYEDFHYIGLSGTRGLKLDSVVVVGLK